jgi:hypothetical protein
MWIIYIFGTWHEVMENHAWLQNFLLQNKNRKVYMLFELDPSREVTGGAWYTEQDYDAEFVDVVKQQCLHFILKQACPVTPCCNAKQFPVPLASIHNL